MWKKLFGPSKEEIWRQLATEVQGQYTSGGFFGQDKVQIQHGEWFIRLDTKTVNSGKTSAIFTQLTAPFANPNKFRFSISRENIFTDIGKFFGMQDIQVGYPEFDNEFLIQGNQADGVRALFANAQIRELLTLLPAVHFQVKRDEGLFTTPPPAGMELLYFRSLGVIKDLDRLKMLYNLFAETLDQLNRLPGPEPLNPSDS